MFANILKKFFTWTGKNENKGATTGNIDMLTEMKNVVTRSSSTLLQDAAGAAALVLMLVIGLNLPGLL